MRTMWNVDPATKGFILRAQILCSALQHVGVLDTKLAKTADAVFKQIVDPIIQDTRHCVLHMPKQGVKDVLRWNPSTAKVIIFAKLQIFHVQIMSNIVRI